MFYEYPLLVFIESYSQLFLGVHDDGPIPGDGLSDGFAGYQEEAEEGGIYSIVSVPFSVKGRIIGVLRLYTSQPRNFSQEEIGFFEALAEMGALAIENARMHEQLRKDYENVMSDILMFIRYRRSI